MMRSRISRDYEDDNSQDDNAHNSINDTRGENSFRESTRRRYGSNGLSSYENATSKDEGLESEDGEFDLAYPSARALETRSSLVRSPSSRKISIRQKNAYVSIISDHEEPLDDSEYTEVSLKGSEPSEDNRTRNLKMSKLQYSSRSFGSDCSYNFGARINFLKDPPEQMTIGRKIALKLMYKKWYNPRAATPDEDNNFVKSDDSHSGNLSEWSQLHLQRAWAYFEHVVMTRYVVEDHNTNMDGWGFWQKFRHTYKNAHEEFERAQPGENQRQTKLYEPISTPHLQLGDFGLGFGLYFSTLRAMGYVLFVAGCISTFNIYYFASDRYAESGALDSNPLLYGSAICTAVSWELCQDCQCDNTTQGWDRTIRCASSPEGLTWVVKNNCMQEEGSLQILGLVNFGTIIFLFLMIFALGPYLKKETIEFDEDEQTAQDYSILIGNPPPKANNPDTWRNYFEKNFPGVKCAAITCAVSNDLLVRALVSRREVLRKMELQLDPGTRMDIDHLALLAAKAARKNSGFTKRVLRLVFPALPDLLSRLVALNTSIKGLAQLSYPCTKVFVTFERESDQRQVLSKLAVGSRHVRRNNGKVLDDSNYLFEGKLLKVSESVEPDTVRWQDLNATRTERMDQQVMTAMLTFAIIFAVAKVVQQADNLHNLGAAFCIAGFNLIFPQFAKLLVNCESHSNESKVQRSLYWKIALFRWVNTAIVITVITPFTHTLAFDDGLIPQIYSIFFAEIFTTNVIQLTDVWGHFQRHVLAPRAVTQDSMNLCFQGLEVELAERYTNMTKIMFLAFWYCSIFPSALLLASAALLINYYTDRFSLMRTWKRAPHISTEISTYSRHYFFSSTCIFLAAMSSFYWSAYPFDNLCLVENQNIESSLFGTYTAVRVNSEETEELVVDADSLLFKFCEQDYILGSLGVQYPFVEGEWMDLEQQKIAALFAWTSVGIIVFIGLRFVLSAFVSIFRRFNKRTYVEQGDANSINFHEVRNITGYVPQVRSSIFSYPLIACKCDAIGQALYDWTDPDRDHTYYDLTKDADHVLSGHQKRAKHSFSRVKHYKPGVGDAIKARKRALEKRIEMSKSVFNSTTITEDHGLSASRHGKPNVGSVSVERRKVRRALDAPTLSKLDC